MKMRPISLRVAVGVIGFLVWISSSLYAERRPLNDAEINRDKTASERFFSYTSPSTQRNEMHEIEAIYTYILKYHKAVSSEDAHFIASELVAQSHDHNMDPKFMAAIISAESGFNKKATSRAGAKGLGQLMTSTYRLFNITNPYSVSQNISATLKYTKNLFGMWEGKSLQVSYALASYLRGEVAVQRSGGHFSPFTIGYIGAVLARYEKICAVREDL
jgi:soluble lytic murein transglycosylase-like protein